MSGSGAEGPRCRRVRWEEQSAGQEVTGVVREVEGGGAQMTVREKVKIEENRKQKNENEKCL